MLTVLVYIHVSAVGKCVRGVYLYLYDYQIIVCIAEVRQSRSAVCLSTVAIFTLALREATCSLWM